MPMVFGFATHRRQQLEAEFLRIAGSMRQLGAERFWLAGDLANDTVGPASELELLVVHETEQPFPPSIGLLSDAPETAGGDQLHCLYAGRVPGAE